MFADPPEIVAPFVSVHPVPEEKSPFVTNSLPSTNPLLLSSINPTDCSTAVTGVVPAESWNSVVRSDGSYQAPTSPAAKRDAGVNLAPPKAPNLPTASCSTIRPRSQPSAGRE